MSFFFSFWRGEEEEGRRWDERATKEEMTDGSVYT
jgi:hypothetical protein